MPGLTGEVANLIVALKLDDSGFSGKLNNAARALGRLDGGLHQVGRGVGQVGGGLARLGAVAATAAAGGLAAVVTTAASFEQAFTGIEKTVDGTDAQLAELEKTVRQMARTIPVSFEELSAIGEAGGALGIARDSLDEFIDVVARLSVSTNLSSDQAATALGQLGNILHLSGQDFEDFADSLVGLGNAGASTEDQIVDLAARFAAAGNSAGLSKEEILAISSAVASMGVEVEAGGTALSQTFNGITLAIGTGSKEVEAFTDTLGISAAEFRENWQRDALGTFTDFLTELSKLDQFEQANVLEKAGITGVRQQNAIRLMTQNLGFFADQLEVAQTSQGALDEESQKFFDTASGQWKTLVNNVRDAAATIGTELLPITKELIDDFINEINKPETQANIVAFGKDLAAGVRGLVGELRGTDFSGLIGGMKIAAEVAKGAFDAFRALPAPVQQLAIAALVANKVSGGAVGQIAKGLGNILLGGAKVGGGLAGIFGGRGASPVSPLYVAVTNQLPGTGGGVPNAPGFWSGIVGNLVKAGLFVGVATAIGEVIAQNVTRPLNPTQFDFNAIAGASGNFTRQQGAEDFAKRLAAELDIPLDDVKQSIVDAVNTQGLTFDQAVASLRGIETNTNPNKRTGSRSGLDTSPTEGERAIAQGGANLTTAEFIAALSRTTEIGLKGVGTTIEHGITTGLDPFGALMLTLARTAENPKDPPVLREINNHIIAAEELQRAYIKSGDLNSARQVQATIDGLHELVGTVDKTNDYIVAVGNTAASDDRAMLNVAQQFSAEQRRTTDTARAIANAAQDTSARTRESGGYLSRIAAKNFSPTINLTNVTQVSVSALALQTQINRIRIAVNDEFRGSL